ncbi:phosphatase PAP2 family protein [Bordetella petrii]|uniref:phosphatase PAP2 family protein n=1 Tax=Bordetella petrii TaxID=94624 RepID=UPI001E2C8421|nr:phosphatase PAP2 family protein [Bordetella petrii]MCD0505862.1 phosphatase PAP2 family protein [Bordetella petrii]
MPAHSSRPFRGVALTACFAVVLLLMSRWIDQPLTHAIERYVPESVNEVFNQIGDLGDSEGYILAGLLVYVLSLVGMRRGWTCPVRVGFEQLARYSMLLLGTMAIGGLITLVLKKIVARTRPEVLLEQGWHGLGVPFAGDPFDSFPSSHTLTAFAVAAVIGEIAPRWRMPVMLLAALVAISRVINRDHFLSDVTTAAFIGIMVAHYLAPYILAERYRWMLRAPWHWRRGA